MKENIKNKLLEQLNKLEGFHSTQRTKYRRNYRMFEYSPNISLDNLDDSSAVGYYQQGFFDIEDDTTSSVQENVIRSCIETLIADVASRKVIPRFNTVNGQFRDFQISRELQQYFDLYYRNINLNKLVCRVFQDACVFEQGIVYVDRDTLEISRCLPWQVFVDPREASYNSLTQVAWKREQYPVRLLPLKKSMFPGNMETVTYWNYWDLNEGKRYYYIPEINYWEEEDWKNSEGNSLPIPFIFLNYSNPIKGTSCQSIVDVLYGIQMAIDAIVCKIKDASQLASPLVYFVPEDGDNKPKVRNLSNRVGTIITYSNMNGGGNPVTVATHPAMDPQWVQLLDKFKQDAYELVGVSQLSASSKKPAGLNSGVAIESMENIEANRFETQLNNIIRTYNDITSLMIQLVDGDVSLLPYSKFRPDLKWGDVRVSVDQMSLQFTAGEMFSSDPVKKLEQVTMFENAGKISGARANQLLEIPDLEQGYNFMNNNLNAVLKVIDDCIENDIYDYPVFVDDELLKEEIVNTQMSLFAGGSNSIDNKEDIEKLTKLLNVVLQRQGNAMTSAEMAATNSINQEIQADLADPNGQINQAIGQANQIVADTNINEEETNNE